MDRADLGALGALGERIACEYLVKKGYNIVGQNWRITFGEIDIIARNGKTIHFVEVKAILDKGGFFPEQHVDYKKQRKLRQMAQIWLSQNNYPQDIPHQIDIIGILVNQITRNAKLHYFPNAVEGS